ncbi:aminotransferase, LLPSF_NHT_00031 family [Pseudobutyrivibrio sp. NOR37]|uniref:LegC family aminotransferase n=1 Tax=Pseudobutyrivibrio xylanivorans TaxID=185007 RepID=A0A6M0LI34_PSEXY|nr:MULTISPECIES: LegC family aminotransferase [Pseudobutyrivibrio]NEX02228.1 LegC family aminotransferase [Pseudobutyrivibrio xylanivorans]SFR77161.1 aminotransferase, LLPSF_NHT_00031 family [Pseudobutyrivibrio sp. NOR37]
MADEFIALSVPNLKGNELKYVTDAVETEWVSTAGPYVSDFEKKLAEYVHVPAAVSTQNGTSALHISLMLCGVTREDAVIVPTLTFIAAVNPTKYIGAEPIFMDCDDSLCMDPVKLKKFCEEECDFTDGKLIDRATGRHIKAMVVVHVFGNMADMEAILPIAEKYNIRVVEDATEALGTYYTEGKFAGRFAGTFGDFGCYSFNGNKIITTGGGGMIVAKNPEELAHAKHLTTQAKADQANFIHDEIGFNYRMTNLQAALGLAQLEQLEDFIKTKTANYNQYKEAIDKIEGLHVQDFRPGTRSNYWFYSVVFENDETGRDALIEELKENHIQSRPIWGLISDQLPYEGARTYDLVKAPWYWKRVVNVPCSTNLTSEGVDRVINVIRSFMS